MGNFLVLCQYRAGENSEYNDFVGKFYHFPGHKDKSYLKQFDKLPIDFVYYEPGKSGKGEYFGCGRITKKPFEDKREKGYYFVEISDYKKFRTPVSFHTDTGPHRELDNPHYNSNNSVRKIPKEIFQGICLDGEMELNFKADAHLIKVLGEQLIASEKVGVLELIKNAYDANASSCEVRIERSNELRKLADELYDLPSFSGPVISITDDGEGMAIKDIENGWLRPASTMKTNVKEKLRIEREKALNKGSLGEYNSILNELLKARKNRLPLGEKGVGRFATHRLGKKLKLTTKRQELDYDCLLYTSPSPRDRG